MKTGLPFLQLLFTQLLATLHILNPEGTTPTPGRGGDTKLYETGTEILISSYCPLLPYSEVIQEKNLGPRTFPSGKLKVYKLDSWFPINSKMTLSRKQLVAKTSLWKARNFKSSDEILFSESTIDLKDYPISRSPGKHQKKVPSKHFWVLFIHWFQARGRGHLPDMFLYHTLLYN